MKNRDYEDTFGKSYNRLNTIFQTVYGMTIKQMQVTLRVNQAKRMLRSGYTISETSTACGFEDYFYFLKVFKSVVTVIPMEIVLSSRRFGSKKRCIVLANNTLVYFLGKK